MKFNFIIIPLIIALTAYQGSKYTRRGLGEWYSRLKKPKWTPTGELIGSVWTMLYIFIAIAVLWYWNIPVHTWFNYVTGAVLLIVAALNVYWNYLFFVKKDLSGAYKEMIILNIANVAAAILMGLASYIAVFLFIPYLLWVGFATNLTKKIVKMNK